MLWVRRLFFYLSVCISSLSKWRRNCIIKRLLLRLRPWNHIILIVSSSEYFMRYECICVGITSLCHELSVEHFPGMRLRWWMPWLSCAVIGWHHGRENNNFLGHFCPRWKGVVRSTLCDAPTNHIKSIWITKNKLQVAQKPKELGEKTSQAFCHTV